MPMRCLSVISMLFEFRAQEPVPYPCSGIACSRPGPDPSALQRTAGGYYVTLVTGSGAGEAFGMKYLDPYDYSKGWLQGENSYLIPPWLQQYEPWKTSSCGDGVKSACPFWAPDLPSNGNGLSLGNDSFIMYYSVPAIDGQGSGCIGMARGVFEPPSNGIGAKIAWTDAGTPVVCGDATSSGSGGPHTFDPSVVADGEGRWWLSYGSWSSTGPQGGGIWIVELDPASGMMSSRARQNCGNSFPYCWTRNGDDFRNIANNPQEGGMYDNTNALEASYLFNYNGGEYFFLFVNQYWCCRGLNSTYEIRVGRAKSPLGPFLDQSGKDMRDGGGTLVVSKRSITSTHTMVGPGHAGILKDHLSGEYVITFDYQGVDTASRMYQTQARILRWQDDWPIVTDDNFVPLSHLVSNVVAV